uniref:Uncharacterized protein n=1 Tax=Plectus sambesii TaxID=2011161 RepID=A0A914XND8_9BILA
MVNPNHTEEPHVPRTAFNHERTGHYSGRPHLNADADPSLPKKNRGT